MRLFVYDMLVNVNVIYYVHVCEQARWARSAGNSAIENLCIIIMYYLLASALSVELSQIWGAAPEVPCGPEIMVLFISQQPNFKGFTAAKQDSIRSWANKRLVQASERGRRKRRGEKNLSVIIICNSSYIFTFNCYV